MVYVEVMDPIIAAVTIPPTVEAVGPEAALDRVAEEILGVAQEQELRAEELEEELQIVAHHIVPVVEEVPEEEEEDLLVLAAAAAVMLEVPVEEILGPAAAVVVLFLVYEA